MIVKILGSAAGGGFPQWNCNAPLSRRAWNADPQLRHRTQSSLAISADGDAWVVFNASPDIRQQIARTPELHPYADGGIRNSPIKAVVITNADIDHIAGLLSLRERQPFSVYATERVLATLKSNSVFDVLSESAVKRIPIKLDTVFTVEGLTVTPFDVPGKVPLFLENEAVQIASQGLGDTIGIEIRIPDKARIHYIPGCAAITTSLLDRIYGSDCLIFDGTLFEDNELVALSISEKTGRRMGHIPINGEGGSIDAFHASKCAQRVYVHLNTTNPILDPDSDAARKVRDAGWEIAYDGFTVSF